VGAHTSERFDGLSEFVSRCARVELIDLILKNGMTQGDLAAKVGVTQSAVSKWLNPRETHPCNKNLDRLIDLAYRVDRNRTLGILRGELLTFARFLSEKFQQEKLHYNPLGQ
jgi:transcriptional regulator with XRE-family HTH domain